MGKMPHFQRVPARAHHVPKSWENQNYGQSKVKISQIPTEMAQTRSRSMSTRQIANNPIEKVKKKQEEYSIEPMAKINPQSKKLLAKNGIQDQIEENLNPFNKAQFLGKFLLTPTKGSPEPRDEMAKTNIVMIKRHQGLMNKIEEEPPDLSNILQNILGIILGRIRRL